MRKFLIGVAAVAAIGLGGCQPTVQQQPAKPAPYAWPGAQPGQQQPGFGPFSQNQPPGGAQGPNGPQPGYPQPQGPQGPYAQNGPYPQQPQGPYQQQPQYPQQPQQPYQQGPGGGQLQVSGPPQGMNAMQSQAGYVFTTRMSGSPQASKMLQGLQQGVSQYFDQPPQIMGNQTDPSDHMAQAAFQTTLHGAPVMGIMAVVGNGQNDGIGYLLFDSPDRVQQTMPMMMAATRGGGGGQPQGGGGY